MSGITRLGKDSGYVSWMRVMKLVSNIVKIWYCKYYVELRAEIDVRKRSLEQIYAVLETPCSNIPTPYTNPAAPYATIPTPYTKPTALSATTAAFRLSVTTCYVTNLIFYATIAVVLRKFIKTRNFLCFKHVLRLEWNVDTVE